MMCKVNLQNLVLVFVFLLSEITYTSAQSDSHYDQATYDSSQQLSPAASYQQQQQLQNPRYEIDVDTYYYDAATSSQKGNETASTKKTQQNDPPKQVGIRVEYDLIEPDPPTTPKPYPGASYDAQSYQSQVQSYQPQVQASLSTYNSVPQSQQYAAYANVATPTFQTANQVDLSQVPQSQQYAAYANVATPTFQTVNQVDLSQVPQSQQYAAYANVATPTFQTANRVDANKALSYYDRLVQRSNYVNPSYPTQQARTANQLNPAQVHYIRQQLQARLMTTQNLRRAQIENLQRQRLAVQQRNSRQLYQSVPAPAPNQGTNQIQGTLEMKCTSLYEAWNLQHMKNMPSTCGSRLRCPELYARTVQNGRFCMCCSNYASVVGAYRKAMQQRQSQNQYRRY